MGTLDRIVEVNSERRADEKNAPSTPAAATTLCRRPWQHGLATSVVGYWWTGWSEPGCKLLCWLPVHIPRRSRKEWSELYVVHKLHAHSGGTNPGTRDENLPQY